MPVRDNRCGPCVPDLASYCGTSTPRDTRPHIRRCKSLQSAHQADRSGGRSLRIQLTSVFDGPELFHLIETASPKSCRLFGTWFRQDMSRKQKDPRVGRRLKFCRQIHGNSVSLDMTTAASPQSRSCRLLTAPETVAATQTGRRPARNTDTATQ